MRIERHINHKKSLYNILLQWGVFLRGDQKFRNNRVSTTVSSKHWALLNKYAEKYGTQQKALEIALDTLENNSKPNSNLSPEQEIWVRISELKLAGIVQLECLKLLTETADLERFRAYENDQKPLEYVIEFFYQKPLKECSLKEIIDGLILNAKISHWFDTVSYTDDGDFYMLKMTHQMGINNSKINEIMIKGVFKTYKAKVESTISERSIFIKVYK
jgi:hypothetical protein